MFFNDIDRQHHRRHSLASIDFYGIDQFSSGTVTINLFLWLVMDCCLLFFSALQLQLQSLTSIPKILLVHLMKINDLATVLLDISKGFNISKVLDVLSESFLHRYDTYEHHFSEVLASIINTVPLNNMVDLTSKILFKSMTRRGKWNTH